MVFTSARLQNYRSYKDSSFEFDPGVNIIVGQNASGKTNLLDSLHYVATGSLIRPSGEYVVHNGDSWARVDVLTDTNQERIIKMKNDEKPEFTVEEKAYKRLPLDKKVPVVLFEPNHLYQITTSPEQRRQLLDDILAKVDGDFIALKNNYIRTLRQRNSLLKLNLHDVRQQIFAWDIRLCELAGQYVHKRFDLIKEINGQSNEVYSEIANKKYTLQITYESKVVSDDYATKLLKLLQDKLELDHLRGFTGYGPHRDDVSILINGNDMRSVASRGETRSILLTLKVVESRLLEDVYKQKPLLLLDDVFGELDGSRRKSLIEFMSGSQTFITTTDADIISHDFVAHAKLLTL